MEGQPPAALEPKAKRIKRDLPTGIIYNPAKNKYEVRIKGRNDKNKLVQIDRPIPGLFDTLDDAVEKQAAAQQKWDAGEAVWSAPPAGNRNVRGQVCVRHCARTISFTISRRRAFVSGTKAASWLDGREEEVERRRAAVEESHRHRPWQQASEPRQQGTPAGQAVRRPRQHGAAAGTSLHCVQSLHCRLPVGELRHLCAVGGAATE